MFQVCFEEHVLGHKCATEQVFQVTGIHKKKTFLLISAVISGHKCAINKMFYFTGVTKE